MIYILLWKCVRFLVLIVPQIKKNEFWFNSQTAKITILYCNKYCCHPFGIFSTWSVKRKEAEKVGLC